MITIYLKQYNKIIRNADPDLFDELGYDDILWIDLMQPSIKEQKSVENFMEISLQTRQQAEALYRPRPTYKPRRTAREEAIEDRHEGYPRARYRI